jgi:hypothetical protein
MEACSNFVRTAADTGDPMLQWLTIALAALTLLLAVLAAPRGYLAILELRDRRGRGPKERTLACEHTFLTSQGHPRAEFQRAIERGNLLQAKALAKVVAQSAGKLSLGDALALLVLMAAKHDVAYERAALRWLVRFVNEVPGVTLEEAQLALAALATMDRLEKDGMAQAALVLLCRRHAIVTPSLRQS